MNSFVEVKSYADVYRQKFSRENQTYQILEKETKKPVVFGSSAIDQRQKKEIAYNLALYRICHGIESFSDEQAQADYDATIFESATPIILAVQKLVKEQARSGKVEINQKQLDKIRQENADFKYTDDIIARTMAPQNLHAICENTLDENIDTNQDAFDIEGSHAFVDGSTFRGHAPIKFSLNNKTASK